MQHSLHFSEQQKSDIFLLRRAFLKQQAMYKQKQEDVQQELKAANHSLGDRAVDEILWQMEDLEMQMQETYFTYKGVIFDGVCLLASSHYLKLVTCMLHTLSCQ